MSTQEIELANFVGDKIKQFRKQHGLTQRELAKKIGKSANTVSDYEKAISTIPTDTLFEISNVLGVTIDEFFPKSETKKEVEVHQPLLESNEKLSINDIQLLKELTNSIAELNESDKEKLLTGFRTLVNLVKD